MSESVEHPRASEEQNVETWEAITDAPASTRVHDQTRCQRATLPEWSKPVACTLGPQLAALGFCRRHRSRAAATTVTGVAGRDVDRERSVRDRVGGPGGE